ncbi:alpha/beta hydrolase [Tunicatimonas pelagia]|uniref:alpha/beta hydrolase n=1 Tax=Tunicatimonas pelagia TaxID=931531 RepID=UPI0026658604|nr:alpha/beta hydrolase [Tunicatimonas pelagia]WKN43345.1 alpha/beta hydrolase [Tunicatimonas pelagia]
MFPHFSSIAKLARLFTLLTLLFLSIEPLIGQHEDPLPFDTANYELQEVVYKTTPQANLQLHFYKPKSGLQEPSPTVLFFFGGGWTGGNHQHFATHSKYLATRGITAITADYRVKKKHGTTPIEAIQDARDALRYLAEHGTEIGIDTAKIAVGGGSAGGHLALCTALIDHFDEAEKLEYVPKALVLYNPVVNTTSVGFGSKMLGKDTINASPYHHVSAEMPSTLIFHGEDDTTVPISNIHELEASMDSLEVESTIYIYPGQKHGFFNVGRQSGHQYFLETLYRTDQFLIEQGFLTGQPSFELNNKID